MIYFTPVAQSTPLRDLSDVTPVTFNFLTNNVINVFLVFYDVSGDPLPASAGGARDVAMETEISSFSHTTGERFPSAFVAPDSTVASVTIEGGAFRVADLGAGGNSLRLTPSGGSDAAGAVSYTLQIGNAPTRTS